MVEAQEKAAIDKGMRVIWLIWAGMFTSLLIYVLVCHLLSEWVQIVRDEKWSDSVVWLLRKVLYSVALFELILSFYLKKFFLKVRPRVAEAHIVTRTSHLNQPPYVGQYNVTLIILLALSESIGIYGLWLFLLRGDFKTLYTFIIISALAMVFYRPKREELERLAKDYKQRGEESH